MKKKINSRDFRVRHGEKVKLREWPTRVKPFCKSKKQYRFGIITACAVTSRTRTTLQRVDLEDSEVAAPGDDELLAVNDALDKLTAKGLTTLANPKQAWSSLALLPLDVATGT